MQGHADTVIGDPASDFCTFLDLTLLMAPGLSDSAMLALFKATALGLTTQHPAAQKKAYKSLAFLATTRPAVLRQHLSPICGILVDSVSVQAAARRHRLACIAPVVSLLLSSDCPPLAGVTLPEGAGDPAQAVVSTLITELVLCTKEVNAKARTQAYEVLVQIAHALHAAHPPELSMDTGVPTSHSSHMESD
jgi:ribosomal RNA-processing protein 12